MIETQKDLLEKILPAFGVLTKKETCAFIDKANECLIGTDVMLLLCGDGVQIVSRYAMVEYAEKEHAKADTAMIKGGK